MKKLLYFCIALFLLILLALPTTVAAEKINSFDVVIDVQADGHIQITEEILYDFSDLSRHGIYRDIPLSSKVANKYRNLQITPVEILRNAQPEPYTTSLKGQLFSFKIGSANNKISSSHLYQIRYKVQNALGNFTTHDELYWNVTGNDWQIPIQRATAKINSPDSISPTSSRCFAGNSGDQTACLSHTTTSFLHENLRPQQGLTIVVAYPPQSFPASILNDQPASSLPDLRIILIFALSYITLVNLPLTLFLYQKYYRHKPKAAPPHVNFDLPADSQNKRLPPALAGTIDTAILDQNDVIATIYDLAIRRHIRIKQQSHDTNFLVFKQSKSKYYLEKLEGQAADSLSSHEAILLQRLFQDHNLVDLETLNKDFYKTFQQLEKDIYQQLITRGFYISNAKQHHLKLLLLGSFSIFFGAVIPGLMLLHLANQHTNRTTLGNKIDAQIDGLKLFLQKMDRNYTWQTSQLAIVEQMIPYAIAFGYINEFMDQLQIIMPDYQPTWYSGTANFYSATPSLISSFSTNISTSHPSSSGSSSGFSGGGGGGGGGGSW